MNAVAELRSSVVGKNAFTPAEADAAMGHELWLVIEFLP